MSKEVKEQEETTETYRFANRESWFDALQEAPSEKWIKTRDLSGSKKSRYIPLGIQEALADLFFRECDIIDNEIGYVNNQIVCRLKMSILPNYPNAEHRIIAGVGARVMTKAGNSLEYGAASAQSAAKSNAFMNFANVFGRNLNRGFNDGFSYAKSKKE